MGRRAGVRALLVAVALALAGPTPATVPAAHAEHEVAYRYTVLGYVTDPDGNVVELKGPPTR